MSRDRGAELFWKVSILGASGLLQLLAFYRTKYGATLQITTYIIILQSYK